MFFLQQFNSEKKFKNENKSPGKIIPGSPMLATRLHSRDSDQEKLLSIFAQINCQSFVSPESQQYAFINIGKDVLLFIVGKENMHNIIYGLKIFLSKDIAREKKKSIKNKIKVTSSGQYVYLFF